MNEVAEKKYVRQTAPYSCCQLVSLFNAQVFYGQEPHPQEGEEFEALVDLVKCRHGAAIAIEKAYAKLGYALQAFTDTDFMGICRNLHEGRPVEFAGFHKTRGFHSFLVVDVQDQHLHITGWNDDEDVSKVTLEEFLECLPEKGNRNRRMYAIIRR